MKTIIINSIRDGWSKNKLCTIIYIIGGIIITPIMIVPFAVEYLAAFGDTDKMFENG